MLRQTFIFTFVFFFFQAEDGIRDLTVTGVQTCALPISLSRCVTRYACTRWVRARRDTPACKTMMRTTITRDRKSTRLNSSHSQISYAVFCLKKKKKKNKLNKYTSHINKAASAMFVV